MNMNPTIYSPERKKPIIDNELKEDYSEDEYQNDAFNEEVPSPSISQMGVNKLE